MITLFNGTLWVNQLVSFFIVQHTLPANQKHLYTAEKMLSQYQPSGRTMGYPFLLLVFILFMGCRTDRVKPITLIKNTTTTTDTITTVTSPIPKDLHAIQDIEAKQPPQNIQIALVGDIMMDKYIANYIDKHGVDYPWSQVKPILSKANLAMANLETSISTRGETTKAERFGFRSHPDTLQGVVNAGFDVVTTANNHILDYGPQAHLDTLRHLETNNILHTGSGEDINAAEAPAVMEHDGQKICSVGYSQIIPKKNWQATTARQGFASITIPYQERAFANIKKLKAQSVCDLILVNVHWGYEYKDYPTKAQKKLAYDLVDHGADAVIGHHPHVLQGIELYNGKPILYSLGNFVFLLGSKEASNSGVFLLNFTDGVFTDGQIVPTFIHKCRANLLQVKSARGQQILQRIRRLSYKKGFTITKQGRFFPTQNPLSKTLKRR